LPRPRSAVGLVALLGIGACATAPGPGAPGYPYNVSGAYAGRLHIDDQPFDATLRLRIVPGGRVDGMLRVVSPVEIEGQVRGNVLDDLLRLTIGYRSRAGCEGRIDGILTVERGGALVEGPVTVTDCGERIAGRMSFRRTR
jgi:hypothetical protein